MAQVKQTESDEVIAIAQEIRRLVEDFRPREAFEVAARGLAEHPESKALAHWHHALERVPARSAGPASGRERKGEAQWLQEHAREYKGQWVALLGNKLLAAGPYEEVRKRVQAMGLLKEALFHYTPEDYPSER